MRRFAIPITGTATTAYTPGVEGLLEAIYINIGDQPATSDVAITENESAAAILTATNVAASAWYAPRIGTHGVTGTASLYAAGGTAVETRIPIHGQIKVVLAQGGAGKAGTVYLYVSEA